jgi:hypothetical protein
VAIFLKVGVKLLDTEGKVTYNVHPIKFVFLKVAHADVTSKLFYKDLRKF